MPSPPGAPARPMSRMHPIRPHANASDAGTLLLTMLDRAEPMTMFGHGFGMRPGMAPPGGPAAGIIARRGTAGRPPAAAISYDPAEPTRVTHSEAANARTSASIPSRSASEKRATEGLSTSKTPNGSPSAKSGTTSSERDAVSQVM